MCCYLRTPLRRTVQEISTIICFFKPPWPGFFTFLCEHHQSAIFETPLVQGGFENKIVLCYLPYSSPRGRCDDNNTCSGGWECCACMCALAEHTWAAACVPPEWNTFEGSGAGVAHPSTHCSQNGAGTVCMYRACRKKLIISKSAIRFGSGRSWNKFL